MQRHLTEVAYGRTATYKQLAAGLEGVLADVRAASGRLLLVATTNLDTEETVVWNMGVVAAVGGDRARALFRDILVASSSVPGALPPVMITVQHKGRSYEEMHVDGGVAIPFFVVSASQSIANRPRPDVGVDVFVIVNGPLSATPTTTPRNTIAVSYTHLTLPTSDLV